MFFFVATTTECAAWGWYLNQRTLLIVIANTSVKCDTYAKDLHYCVVHCIDRTPSIYNIFSIISYLFSIKKVEFEIVF